MSTGVAPGTCQRTGCASLSGNRRYCTPRCATAAWRDRQPKHPDRRCPDVVGHQLGRLRVVRRGPNKGSRAQFECQCECGTVRLFDGSRLRTGRVTSCGCIRREAMTGDTNPSYGHGMSTSREWRSWRSMRMRCLDPNNPNYPEYGGRGITICTEWDTFAQFYADMGPRPEGHTLDRADNSRGYSPDNCRWATSIVQNNNRRPARNHPRAKLTEAIVRQMRTEYDAKTATTKELSARYGITPESAWKVVARRTWAGVV